MAKKSATSPRNQAAAEARAKAQAQVRAQERRTTAIIIAVVVVVVGLFAGLVAFIMSQSQGDDRVPSVATEAGGFPVGTTGVVGEDLPEDAVEVRVYADFTCPACLAFEQRVSADLDAMREEGLIELHYHPVAIRDSQTGGNATLTAAAAAAVADGAPELYLDFSHALFAGQERAQQEPWTGQRLADLATSLGAPGSVGQDILSGAFRTWVRDATRQASVDGMGGTPTVMVDGVILDQTQVPYFEFGVLREYIEFVAAQ